MVDCDVTYKLWRQQLSRAANPSSEKHNGEKKYIFLMILFYIIAFSINYISIYIYMYVVNDTMYNNIHTGITIKEILKEMESNIWTIVIFSQRLKRWQRNRPIAL